MPRNRKKQLGSGAVCKCLACFLHPRAVVGAKYLTVHHKYRVDGLLVIKQEVKKVNENDHICIIFNHPDFNDIFLHCVSRYASVKTEGDSSGFFETDGSVVAIAIEEVLLGDEDDGVELPPIGGDLAKDIARLRAEGYGVDDDNEPAPENLPSTRGLHRNVETKEWNG